MNARTCIVVTLLTCSLHGCGQFDASDNSSVPEVNVALKGEFTLDPEPLTIIGRSDTLAGHALHLVQSAVVLSNDVLALAHEGSQSIFYFDSTGTLLRQVGRYGKGPGEFMKIRSLHRLDAGALAAWDIGQQRLAIIGPDGAVMSTVNPGGSNDQPRPRHLYNLGADEFVVVSSPRRTRSPAMSLSREELAVAIIDTTGAVSAELGTMPGDEYFGPLQPLFGYRFLAAATPESFFIGYGRNPELVEYDSNGTVARRLRLPLERKPLGADEWQEIRDRFLTRRIRASDRRMTADLLDRSHNVDSLPAYTDLRSASDGALWIREYAAPGAVQRWLVVDPAGTAASEITLPAESRLLYAAGDRVVLLFSDAVDRQYVRVHRFSRSP